MDRLKSAVVDLGVDLSGPDAGVSKQFLQRTNLGTPCQHMGRETVAKRVWADFAACSNSSRIAFDQLPDSDPRQAFSTA